MVLTKQQRAAIKRVYDRSADGAKTYLEFRRRVKGPMLLSDPVIMLQWCGMWLGIERDGYTHS